MKCFDKPERQAPPSSKCMPLVEAMWPVFGLEMPRKYAVYLVISGVGVFNPQTTRSTNSIEGLV